MRSFATNTWGRHAMLRSRHIAAKEVYEVNDEMEHIVSKLCAQGV